MDDTTNRIHSRNGTQMTTIQAQARLWTLEHVTMQGQLSRLQQWSIGLQRPN